MASSANQLATLIQETIQKAQKEQISYESVYQADQPVAGKNEFLFFIKPEITLPSDTIQLEAILDLIISRIKQFELNIADVKVLTAKYLKQHNIIAQHYGVINKLANDAVSTMSDGAKEKFQQLYGSSVNELRVLGGFEVLSAFPEFTPTTLEYLWQNISANKLAGGTYCIEVSFDGEKIYVIDGFHPRQLEHFVAPSRSIVVFTLKGDIDWEIARGEFIGATNPHKASEKSLRRAFLNNKEDLGLSDVSQGMNGVHLSAGPIEGLVELIRYNSNFESNELKTYKDFDFGKKLAEHFSEEQINKILDNMDVEVAGKMESVFDLTEEKNSDESIGILKEYIG